MSAPKRDAFGLKTKVEIAFDSGPSDDPTLATWSDATADTLSVSVDRGRGSESDVMSVGRATITLRDPDGRYDASTNDIGDFPNDGDKIPGRRVRVRFSDVGGLLESWRADRLLALGETSGTVAYDEGAVGGTLPSLRTNGTYAGTVTLGQTGAHALESTTAVTFDGTTGYVNTNRSVSPGTFSTVVWFNETGTAGRHICGANQVFYVRTTAARKIEVGVWVAGAWQICTGTTSISAATWYQVAVGYSHSGAAGELRIYLNGTFEAGVETEGTINTATTAQLYVGRASSTSTYWAGKLQHFAWWQNYQVTPVQLQRLWTMSSTGTYLFSGFVASWTHEPDNAPVGVSITTLGCLDGGDLLNQYKVDLDGRSATLRLGPKQYFPFDNESLADLQGGPAAQFAVGSKIEALFEDVFGVRIFTGFRRNTFTPSLSTGISAGAVSLTSVQSSPVTGVPSFEVARVDLPAPSSGSTTPSGFMCWYNSNGAERYETNDNFVGGIQPVLWTYKKIGSLYRHWYFGVNHKGVCALIVADRTGPQPWSTVDDLLVSWEGIRSITNGNWHHLAVRTAASSTTFNGISMNAELYIDGVREKNYLSQVAAGDINIALPDVAWKGVLGGITKTYSVDELSLWYGTATPSADDIGFVYELTASGFAGETVNARCDRLLDLAGWEGARDLSTSAGTVVGEIQDGTAWGLLQTAAAAEDGTFDIAADGTARLRSRQDRRRLGVTPSVTSGGVGGYSDVNVVTDDRYLFTAAQVDDAYYEDATQVAKYGRRIYSQQRELLPNDAASRARGIVNRYSTFAPRTDRLVFELPGVDAVAGLLLDVGDTVTISRQPFRATTTTLAQDVHVERVSVTLDGQSKRGRVTAQLSPVDPLQNTYFTVGVSELDGSDILGW